MSRRKSYRQKLEVLVKRERRGQKSVYVEDELWAKFKEVCETAEYSASEVVEALIRQFLEEGTEKET